MCVGVWTLAGEWAVSLWCCWLLGAAAAAVAVGVAIVLCTGGDQCEFLLFRALLVEAQELRTNGGWVG